MSPTWVRADFDPSTPVDNDLLFRSFLKRQDEITGALVSAGCADRPTAWSSFTRMIHRMRDAHKSSQAGKPWAPYYYVLVETHLTNRCAGAVYELFARTFVPVLMAMPSVPISAMNSIVSNSELARNKRLQPVRARIFRRMINDSNDERDFIRFSNGYLLSGNSLDHLSRTDVGELLYDYVRKFAPKSNYFGSLWSQVSEVGFDANDYRSIGENLVERLLASDEDPERLVLGAVAVLSEPRARTGTHSFDTHVRPLLSAFVIYRLEDSSVLMEKLGRLATCASLLVQRHQSHFSTAMATVSGFVQGRSTLDLAENSLSTALQSMR